MDFLVWDSRSQPDPIKQPVLEIGRAMIMSTWCWCCQGIRAWKDGLENIFVVTLLFQWREETVSSIDRHEVTFFCSVLFACYTSRPIICSRRSGVFFYLVVALEMTDDITSQKWYNDSSYVSFIFVGRFIYLILLSVLFHFVFLYSPSFIMFYFCVSTYSSSLILLSLFILLPSVFLFSISSCLPFPFSTHYPATFNSFSVLFLSPSPSPSYCKAQIICRRLSPFHYASYCNIQLISHFYLSPFPSAPFHSIAEYFKRY